MRGLGWNPELLGPQWDLLGTLSLEGAWVAGEAALAGYWLHHRQVAGLEVHALPGCFERLQAELPAPVERLFPGCVRAGGITLVRDTPLEPPTTGPIPAASLVELAVDGWLRGFGAEAGGIWLVDLYFLERARVDLAGAAERMACRDLAATRRALAVILHQLRIAELPAGLLRPVSLEQLDEFRQRWTAQLALEMFS